MIRTINGWRPERSKSGWVSMLRTARVPLAIVSLISFGLLVLPQMRDLLAGISDYTTGFWKAVAYHLSLFVLAFAAWFWARTVLAARFEIVDLKGDAARGNSVPIKAADPEYFDWIALEYTPRLLFLAVAFAGMAAAIQSGELVNAGIVFLWSAIAFALLVARVKSGDRVFLPPRQPRKSTFWTTAEDLHAFSPLGRWVTFAFLVIGTITFGLSVFGTFFPDTLPASYGIAWFASLFPGAAALFMAMALLIGPLVFLTYWLDPIAVTVPLYGVRLLLFNRPPVLTALAILVVGTPTLVSLHNVRIIDPNRQSADAYIWPSQRASLEMAFDKWADACAGGGRDQKKVYRPIIVAVSGGASRAGLWAARVLTNVDAAARGHNTSIFAISSVSGGSLGAAAYVATIAGQPEGPCGFSSPDEQASSVREMAQPSFDSVRDEAIRDATADDNLAPALSGMLLADAPRGAFGLPAVLFHWATPFLRSDGAEVMRGGDRADALERGFEQSWTTAIGKMRASKCPKPIGALKEASSDKPADTAASDGQPKPGNAGGGAAPTCVGLPKDFSGPFLKLFYEKDGAHQLRGNVPLWFANGADVRSGDRLITSPIRLDEITDPAAPSSSPQSGAATLFHSARDVLGILSADVPISTAILNTARFPYVSPAGELAPLNARPGEPPLQLVDGGYFDNEGIRTALELARRLRSLGHDNIRPIIIVATADAESIDDTQIARCGSTDNPLDRTSGNRPSQLLAPLLGILTSRTGQSHNALREAVEEFCTEPSSFFHFYMYPDPDQEIPLNWVISAPVARYVWNKEFLHAGNSDELTRLLDALSKTPTAAPATGISTAPPSP